MWADVRRAPAEQAGEGQGFVNAASAPTVAHPMPIRSSLALALTTLLAAAAPVRGEETPTPTPSSAVSDPSALSVASPEATRSRRAPTPTSAEPLPFAPGEQIDVVIDYLHVRTGQARLMVGKPEGAVWPVICQARTEGVAGLLDIREHYVTYWDAERHLSRGSDLNAIEVGDRHTDRARFDRENGKAIVQVLRKGRAQESTHDVPRDVQDLASALLALRMKPLQAGDRYELPVFSGTVVFTLRAEVEGDEVVETPAGRFDTTRVKVQLGFKDRFRTRRDAHVWLSRDARHIPVRMSADFAVGSVAVTLSGYRPGGPLAASR